MTTKVSTVFVMFGLAILALAVVSLGTAPLRAAEAGPSVLSYDPSKIVAEEADSCGLCHERTVEAWMESMHSITFDEMHERDESSAIIEALGLSGNIRRNAECVTCHYTQAADEPGGRPATVMGISCQRCHGEAADWMDLHGDGDTYPDKMERLKLSEEKGMRPTYNIYNLASNCYQCHTVPREELVNTGGHPAGSDFELVAWTQGEVRHNFMPLPDEEENKESPIETRRLMFVLGKILDLEYGLRGLAQATGEGGYLDAMGARVTASYEALASLDLGVEELSSILESVPTQDDAPKVAASNRAEYVAAADAIGELARALEAKKEDYASELAKVDGMLPDEYRGDFYE